MPPVSSSGATLNATMYDTPITVPGIAKLTMRQELERAAPDEAVARDDVGGEQADERGQRRRDRRDLRRC